MSATIEGSRATGAGMPMAWRWLFGGAIALASLGWVPGIGGTEPLVVPSVAEEPVARLDGETIVERREVDRLLASTVDVQRLSQAEREVLWREARDRLVGRQLWLNRWRRLGSPPTTADIEAELTALKRRLEHEQSRWEQHLEQLGVSAEAFRASVAWKLGWRAELERTMTDENLRRHFEAYRREFDGTQLEVSQILKPLNREASAEESARVERELVELREQILSGKISFADAARQHSQGASAAQGGRLGRVERQGAMPEAFSKAAFALEVGQISQPVRTANGWHLIRCDAETQGAQSFEQCFDEVYRSAAQAWFDLGVRDETARHQLELLD